MKKKCPKCKVKIKKIPDNCTKKNPFNCPNCNATLYLPSTWGVLDILEEVLLTILAIGCLMTLLLVTWYAALILFVVGIFCISFITDIVNLKEVKPK